MPDIDWGSLSDDDLANWLAEDHPRAFLEFATRYGDWAGIIINRLNAQDLADRPKLRNEAVWKVLDLVQRDLARQPRPLTDPRLKKRTTKGAAHMAIVLWRWFRRGWL